MGWKETSQGLWDPLHPRFANINCWDLSFHPRFFLKFFLKCNQNCLKNAGNPRDMRRFQVSTRHPRLQTLPHTPGLRGAGMGLETSYIFPKGCRGIRNSIPFWDSSPQCPLTPFANPNSP